MIKIIINPLLVFPLIIAVVFSNVDLNPKEYGNSKDNDNKNQEYLVGLSDTLVVTEVAKLTHPDREIGDAFGYSFDVDGDYLVVGNPFDDDNGISSGSIYVFERNDGEDENWIETKKITPPQGSDWFYYGSAVAIYGTTIVVGAPGDGNQIGDAFVYERDYGGSGQWGLVKQITPDTIPESASFGDAVDVFGDTIVVGAPSYDYASSALNLLNTYCHDCGIVFIFERNLGGLNNWGVIKQVFVPNLQDSDLFGRPISIHEDILFVGAPDFDVFSFNDNLGAVFIFERNRGGSNNWGKLKDLNQIKPSTSFDKSMSLGDELAIIGTFENYIKILGRDYGGINNWGIIDSISGPIYGDTSFGEGVDIINNRIIIGDFKDEDNGYQAGAAYICSLVGEDYREFISNGKILASDGNVSDGFGNSVSITDDELFISAYQRDDNGIQTGAVYIYKYRFQPPVFIPLMIGNKS